MPQDVPAPDPQAQASSNADEWYSLLLANQIDMTLLLNEAAQIVYASPSVERTMGYPPASLIGRSIFDGVHPDDLDRVRSRFAARMAGAPHNAEGTIGRYRTLAGDYRTCEVMAHPITTPDGRRLVVLNSRDITARLLAEQAAEASGKMLAAILHAVPDAIFIWDHPGNRFKYISANAHRMVGYSAEELLALGDGAIAAILDEEDRARFLEWRAGWATAPPDAVREIEYRACRRDGARRWFLHRSAVMRRDETGQPLEMLGVIQDITDRRLAEQRVREAERLESLGRLAGGIAHDFNNLLGVILGNLEALAAGGETAGGAPVEVDEAAAAAIRARDLVRGILTFSQATERQHAPFDLRALLDDVVRLLRRTLPSTVEMRVGVDPGAFPMVGDASQVQSAVLNLCANAEQAMLGVGGVLELSLDALTLRPGDAAQWSVREGRFARLSVRDTGIGIRAEALPHIFEPFFTTRTVGEGSGMGLAVVHGVVLAHGGSIRVQSAPGAGARFDVLLPLEEEATATAPRVRAAPAAGRRGRILLVDDEPALTRAIGRLLVHLGHEVVSENDALRALELVRAAPDRFDLVLTDLTMPRLAGDALARQLRAIRPSLPVILCTGYAAGALPGAYQGECITRVLAKPVERDTLAAAISAVLGA